MLRGPIAHNGGIQCGAEAPLVSRHAGHAVAVKAVAQSHLVSPPRSAGTEGQP